MWFGNLPTFMELQGFHYFQGKKKMQQYNFLSKKQNKTLISESKIFISHTGLTMGYKRRQNIFLEAALPLDSQGGLSISATAWAYQPKILLHGLSHRKSPIKNHNNIISGRIIIRIKHNQAPQSLTSPKPFCGGQWPYWLFLSTA